jgi:hypothetical protein
MDTQWAAGCGLRAAGCIVNSEQQTRAPPWGSLGTGVSTNTFTRRGLAQPTYHLPYTLLSIYHVSYSLPRNSYSTAAVPRGILVEPVLIDALARLSLAKAKAPPREGGRGEGSTPTRRLRGVDAPASPGRRSSTSLNPTQACIRIRSEPPSPQRPHLGLLRWRTDSVREKKHARLINAAATGRAGLSVWCDVLHFLQDFELLPGLFLQAALRARSVPREAARCSHWPCWHSCCFRPSGYCRCCHSACRSNQVARTNHSEASHTAGA